MKLNFLGLSVALSCLSVACTAVSDNPTDAASPDTPRVDENLERARELAGDDPYLLITERLMCDEPDPSGVAVDPLSRGGATNNSIVEPYQVFDNLYFIGGNNTGSWLITTSDGYMMIDAIYGDSPEKVTIPGLEALGLDPAKLKYILITHAGPDHLGGGRYFQENYGTHIVMSQEDWDAHLNPEFGSWVLDTRPPEQKRVTQREWLGPPEMDIVGAEGDTITLGETTLKMFYTPRRERGGGLSFIVPVSDNGEPHVWGTYGNSGAPRSLPDLKLHRSHILRYAEEAKAAGVDSIMSSHPFVDGSDLRAQVLNGRQPGSPNPFVIGEEGVERYLGIFEQCTSMKIAKLEAPEMPTQ